MVLSIHIGADDVLSRWNLTGDLNFLRDVQNALLKWTLEVYFMGRLAEVVILIEQGDIIPYDLYVDFGARGDLFGQGAAGVDREILASNARISRVTRGSAESIKQRRRLEGSYGTGGFGVRSR